MKPVRVMVVGLGSWGPGWVKLLLEEPATDLAAVVEPIAERRAAVVEHFALRPDQDWDSLHVALREVDTDAVLIVTPPQTHLHVGQQVLAAGKPILMEKPLASTIEDAREMVEAAEQADQLLIVSQNYRYRPPMVTLKSVLDREEIGAIAAIAADCQEDMRLFYEPTNFRYLMKHPHIIDMTIHHWDLLRFLTGREVRSVDARSWRIPDSPYQHDPACSIQVLLDDGTPMLYEGCSATQRARTSWSSWWEFVGEDGRLWTDGGVDDPHLDTVHLRMYGENDQILPYQPSAPFDQLGSLRAFVGALHGGAIPVHTGRDNLESLRVVMACVESVERGKAVEVAEI